MKKGVLRNFAKFTGKQLWQSLFFNKVAGLRFIHFYSCVGDLDLRAPVVRYITMLDYCG